MSSGSRNTSEPSSSSTSLASLHIAYPQPASQPNSSRNFHATDFSEGASRQPRHFASVPYLLAPHMSHEAHDGASLDERSTFLEGVSNAFHRPFFNSQSLSQLVRLKFKLPYGSARQKINKFVSKGYLPSILYSSDSSSSAKPEPACSSRLDPSDPQRSSTRHLEPPRPQSQNTSLLNVVQVQRPQETASVPNLNASRSRQGSISTIYTTNEFFPPQGPSDGPLAYPGSLGNDNTSIYGISGIDCSSAASYNSSLSSTSNYYAQQYHQHHLQKQLKHSRSLMEDSESGVAFLSEDFHQIKLPAKVDFVQTCPTEIVDEIFAYLDRASVIACIKVNKTWKKAVDSNTVWRSLFHQNEHWETVSGHLPDDQMTWKEVYKTRKILEERWDQGIVKAMALKGHTDSVYCVQYNEDMIVTGSRDQTIKVWDARSGALLKSLGRTARRNAADPTEEDVTETIEAANTQLPFTARTAFLTPSVNNTPTLAAQQDSDQLVHTKSVLCLHFDDTLMISGSSDHSIILWALPEFVPFKKITKHTQGVLSVSLNEKYFCSCSRDGTINIWERPLGELNTSTVLKFKRTLKGHEGPVNSIQLYGDTLFSAGGDALIKQWDIATGTCIRQFTGHVRGLACIQLSPDGKTLVSGSNDKVIRVWDIESCRCLHILEGHMALVRSLDVASGRIISGSYDQSIRIWDLATGKQLASIDNYFGSWIFSAKANLKRIICTSFGSKPVILDFTPMLDIKCVDFLVS